MPSKGFKRYVTLLSNIQNPGEYLLNKGRRFKRSLTFTTKPHAIYFTVPLSLYQVFKEIFMADVYDIHHLLKILPEQPTVVDIGANAGYFDILLLSKLKKAHIYAYEPLPGNMGMAQSIIQNNSWTLPMLSFHQMAVTGTPKATMDLYVEDTSNNQVVASAFSNFNKRNNSKISVPCISFTDIINQNNLLTIDLLKLDCEGSEYDILYNTDESLIKRIKIIVAEVHDLDAGPNNVKALLVYLRALGFSVTHSPLNNFCHTMKAVRQ